MECGFEELRVAWRHFDPSASPCSHVYMLAELFADFSKKKNMLAELLPGFLNGILCARMSDQIFYQTVSRNINK